jgi:CRISPR-associated protein (TIGR02584 family)
MNADDPSTYSRRILCAVTGLSPQIVTETLYALAINPAENGQAPFVPTEVHLITTGRGAKQAVNNLLMPSSEREGWFQRLCNDYHLPPIRFNEDSIHVMIGADGQPLDDIRTPADNELAADFITEKVRELTGDENAALHVSLAGGRKTMGFYLGYALSLFARPQDRLSHVLVSSPYEGHPRFYYPTPYDEIIHTNEKPPISLNIRHAQVSLAMIPIVSLRHGLPTGLLAGSTTFNATVAAARIALSPAQLIINVRTIYITAGGKTFKLPQAEFCLLAVLAYRTCVGASELTAPVKDHKDMDWSMDYLADLRAACGNWHVPVRVEQAITEGVDGSYFSQHLSRLRSCLKSELGLAAQAYPIDDGGRLPHRYKLAISPERIIFEDTESVIESN